jgi:hypothetical protein
MLAWLATGPLGRMAAFVLDLITALIAAARRRSPGSSPRINRV